MAMITAVRPQPLVVLVMLYGVLGARFGRVHHLAVASCAEAVHALCVKVPGFKRFLRLSEERGLTYAVFRGNVLQAPGLTDHHSAAFLRKLCSGVRLNLFQHRLVHGSIQ